MRAPSKISACACICPAFALDSSLIPAYVHSDIILCADCVYDTQMHTPLLMTLRRFLKPSGKAIIMASPRNGSLSEFLKAAHAYFRCDLCVEYDEAVSNRKVEGVPFRQHKCFPHLVTLDMMDMDGHGKDYSILEDGMSKRFVERQQRKLKEAELAESLQSRYLGKRESRRLILTDDELKSSVDRMINPVSSKKKRLEPPYQLAKASASATGRPGTRIQRLGVEMPIAYHPWRERDPLTVRMIRESVELALGSALHADQTTPSGGDNDQVNAEDWTAHVNDMRRPLSADLQGLRAPLVVSERIQRLSQPRPHTPVALRMMPAPAAATKATFASATAEGHCKQAAQNDSGDAEDKMRVLYEQPIPKTPQWRGAPSQARAVSLPHATQHRGELSAAELALASRLFPEHGGEVQNVSSGLHQASRRKLPVAQSRPLSALNSNPWNGISARPSSPPPTVQPASGEGSSLLQDRLDSLQQELRNTSAPKTGGEQAVYKDGVQLLVPLRGELEATPGLPLAGQAGGALTFYPHLQQPLTRATVQRGGACGGRDRAAFDARSMEAVRAAMRALRGGDPERKTPRSCRRPVLHLEHRAHACRSRSSFVPARHTHGRLRQVGPSGRAGTSLALGPG